MTELENTESQPRNPSAKPTVKQIYAIARALCERCGEEFPPSRGEASELIRRLWDENGRPTVARQR